MTCENGGAKAAVALQVVEKKQLFIFTVSEVDVKEITTKRTIIAKLISKLINKLKQAIESKSRGVCWR